MILIKEKDTKAIANKIAKAILADATDRRGWRQEWDQFDKDVQAEIKKTWRRMIESELKEFWKRQMKRVDIKAILREPKLRAKLTDSLTKHIQSIPMDRTRPKNDYPQ